MRWMCLALFVPLAACANAQFVWPKADDHEKPDGLYTEDPFITHYRQEFFAVFKGDYPRFEKAYAEIEKMVAKNPKDARAMVWLGNGQLVKSGLLMTKNKAKGLELLRKSSVSLDKAVALKPDDPNIYMMRAATLYMEGQYYPKEMVDKSVWERLRDDCTKFLGFLGPKIGQVSVHMRGETYGELGIAYLNLGDKAKAKWAFEKILEKDRDTDYGKRAALELKKLGS